MPNLSNSVDSPGGGRRGAPAWLRRLMGAVVALVVLWLLAPIAIVPSGHRGVMTTFGKPSPEVFSEGLHLRIPIVQVMHLMDVRIEKVEGEADAASKDLQTVHTKIAINYHLDPAAVSHVFREIAQSTDEVARRIIAPATQEAVKAITARFTAEELVSRRTEVRDAIGALPKEKMTRHGLLLDEFAIVNFAFSPSFTQAIEAKVSAEQQKLKAERDLSRIQVEAEQKIASAKAEAEALRLQKQEVTTMLIELRRIENERRAIEKWNGILPTTSGGAVPFLNLAPQRAVDTR
ncbi:prohibitin family protein [Schlegelella sp. ID0723]|uniref:Prohibitin family protein n=2 Tax=Piscinibacter koreensis TaxID=2742824 RepID=A0A7Y6NP90_9BURK|nr:prohibitin family protein [Schlegelella koreensis]